MIVAVGRTRHPNDQGGDHCATDIITNNGQNGTQSLADDLRTLLRNIRQRHAGNDIES
jgi:hypothetical protein